MKKTMLDLQNRIDLLKSRDPVMNSKLIKKLERKMRAMTSSK